MKNKPQTDAWCFALINGRLGEVYFKTGKGTKGIQGHCYVDREEFTKREQKMIAYDIQKHRFTYRNKQYTQKVTQIL